MTQTTDISPLARVMRRIDATTDGAPTPDTIPSGFPSLDRMLGGGFRRGDLIVLGGDVGSGKSALALAIAMRIATNDAGTVFFSGEMTAERAMERALAMEGRARVDDLRSGRLDEVTRAAVGAAAVRLRERAPEFLRLPPGGAEALVLELRSMADLDVAIVDGLQNLALGRMELDEELARAVRELKGVAMDQGIALLLTAQTPLLDRQRPDLRPAIADFGALGAIAHHADVVLGLYREEIYAARQGSEGATELAAIKNRNGPITYVDLYFYKQWVRFEDMLDPDR